MKTEKIIKAQSREYLRQGNWSTLVGCLAVLIILFLLVYCTFEALIYVFNLVNLYTMEIKKSGQFLAGIFLLVTLLLFTLISPAINGYIKLCYNVAKTKNCNSIDLFYFFKNPFLYFKVLWLNILRYLIISLGVFLFNLPAAIMYKLSESISGSNSVLFQIAGFSLEILGIIFCFCLYVKIVFSNFILAEDDSKKVFWYIKESFNLSKGHNIDIIKLLLSFIFWILACFFIFPIFYVIPYLGVSLGNSAKWLIQLKKGASDLKC